MYPFIISFRYINVNWHTTNGSCHRKKMAKMSTQNTHTHRDQHRRRKAERTAIEWTDSFVSTAQLFQHFLEFSTDPSMHTFWYYYIENITTFVLAYGISSIYFIYSLYANSFDSFDKPQTYSQSIWSRWKWSENISFPLFSIWLYQRNDGEKKNVIDISDCKR